MHFPKEIKRGDPHQGVPSLEKMDQRIFTLEEELKKLKNEFLGFRARSGKKKDGD